MTSLVNVDLEALESRADALHQEAQHLNREGLFAEAQSKYSEMQKVADEALQTALKEPAQALVELLKRSSIEDAIPPSKSADHGTPDARRLQGMVLGSLVADAAAAGVQWIYDPSKMQQLLQQRHSQPPGTRGPALPTPAETELAPQDNDAGVEFLDPPCSPFFRYACGRQSPYGEQTRVVLKTMAAQGGVSPTALAVEGFSYFGPGFDGYRDACTKGFLTNLSGRGRLPPHSGAADHQINCCTKIPPIAAAYQLETELLAASEAAIRVTQNDDQAVIWGSTAALVMLELSRGSSVATAIATCASSLADRLAGVPGSDKVLEVVEKLEAVLKLADLPHADVVTQLGRNCHLPNALQTPLHAAVATERALLAALAANNKQPTSLLDLPQEVAQQWWAWGVRQAIQQGGCCASRASITGACLGALLGSKAIPKTWMDMVAGMDDIRSEAKAVAALQAGSE